MKSYIVAIVAFMTVMGVFWVGGMEFERGINQAWALYGALLLSAFVAWVV